MKKLMYLLVAGSLSVFTACTPDKEAATTPAAPDAEKVDDTKEDTKNAKVKGAAAPVAAPKTDAKKDDAKK